MIRAQKITEHGREKRNGVQVDFRGEMNDIILELQQMLFSMEQLIDGQIEDTDEKYDAFKEIRKVLKREQEIIEKRIIMHRIGVTEEELQQINEMARNGMDFGEAMEKVAAIGKRVAMRTAAAEAEDELADAIGREAGKDE